METGEQVRWLRETESMCHSAQVWLLAQPLLCSVCLLYPFIYLFYKEMCVVIFKLKPEKTHQLASCGPGTPAYTPDSVCLRPHNQFLWSLLLGPVHGYTHCRLDEWNLACHVVGKKREKGGILPESRDLATHPINHPLVLSVSQNYNSWHLAGGQSHPPLS